MWNVRVSVFGAAICVGLWIAWSGSRMPTTIVPLSTSNALQTSGTSFCIHKSSNRPSYYTSLMGPLATEWFEEQVQNSIGLESTGTNHNGTNSETISRNNCNCMIPEASYSGCCTRTFRGQFHKMGWAMGNQLCREFRLRDAGDSTRIVCPGRPRCLKKHSDLKRLQQHDYREVLMLRDIYESLISGYLYHKSGRECWLDLNGKPYNDKDYKRPQWTNVYFHWHDHINFSLPESSPRQEGDSLCTYLARETTTPDVGMRVYIEFVFWQFYRPSGFLEQLALMNRYRSLRERTFILCFDAFANNNEQKAERTLERAIHFLFPSGHAGHHSITNFMGAISQDHTGHSTSHESNLRNELKSIIQQLDCNYYHGQIAFMDRIIPCGGTY